ncbi:trigger factor [Gemmata sp.]|uniref:trigger factor n=1 Tax=Gemmata sp. TaxID=1914242 RepID=UPI003F718183
MADDTNPEAPATDADAGSAIATVDAPAQDGPIKLKQSVELRDVGPCKKHVKVTVDRELIDERLDEKFTEIVRSDQPQVRGFRPGKAPRKLIEKQYHDSVSEEVKTQVLMASLEQLADEQVIAPLSPPDLDPNAIKLPAEGPFVYEFEIEVRPEFDLPEYKGLKLRRPTHAFTDADVDAEQKRLLESYGQLVPKEPAEVAVNDYLTADVAISYRGKEINTLKEVRVKVEKQLALSDGVCPDFGAKVAGAKPGDVREVEITLGDDLGTEGLRGQKVQATFAIKDVKTIRQPELTRELLEEAFGVTTPEGFREFVKTVLERRLEYTQRQVARQQVLETIGAAATWELPQDMLRRQARKTISRKVMEMKNSGMSDEQIKGRRRLLEQDAMKTTAAALKEHFVLQKVAEVEKIEIEEEDLDREMERMADRTGESVRRVRARLEKEDLIEALATDLLEQKALDLILAGATYEDYEWSATESGGDEVSTVTADAMPDSQAQAADAADKAADEKPAS